VAPGAPDPRSTPYGNSSGPLYFSRVDRPLFGWLHGTEEPPRGVGLLVCNPFGNEAVCAHRTIQHLCEASSRAGIPALRFDYDGTGDSAGHDNDPQRVEAWIESILLAADELKRAAAVESVCLLGIRLGAALAAAATARRDDVIAFIAIAPVVSGKAYLREMRLLQHAIDAKRNSAHEAAADTLETAGFAFSAATQASVAALDITKLERPPARNVLVIDRAELPGDTRWIPRLRDSGAEVDSVSVAGYTEMMLDSHESIVPRDMVRTAIGYLSHLLHQAMARKPVGRHSAAAAIDAILEESHPRATLPPTEHHDEITGPAADVAVHEQAVRFGHSDALFGIVSEPHETTEAVLPGRGKAVLLLNSGAVHHIGPNRLYVAAARHLARQGYVVLRMDIAGLGDSPPRAGEAENIVYSRHALEDVREAIDYLRTGWKTVDVQAVGLCSGAYHAFKAAVAGLAVTGVVLINPLTFFWKDGMSLAFPEHRVAADIVRYRQNVFRLGPWLKMLRGQVNLWELSQVLVRRLWTLALQPLRSIARKLRIPLQDDLPSELNAIARMGIRLRFVFAEDDPGQELLSTLGGKVGRRLQERGSIAVETIGGADHTFTDRSRRTLLVAALDRALSESA